MNDSPASFAESLNDRLMATLDHVPPMVAEVRGTMLGQGRADWRRKQLAAAVRDAPGVAANTLRELGFTALPPDDGIPPRTSAGSPPL